MNKKILQLALPSIISNITVPLLGLIDVAIVGHLGATAYIGAVAVGGMLFNILYWSFGFLRMGTSGLTSQAYGAGLLDESVRTLIRSLIVGIGIGVLFIAFQLIIENIAFYFIETSDRVRELAVIYFRICIWGAPALLALYGFTGWFIGMQNSRIPMFIAIAQNIINIVVSLCLVFLFEMKVEGVAIGTLVAQYGGLIMAVWLYRRYYKKLGFKQHWPNTLCRVAMKRFFSVNSDIFLRTLCLVSVSVFFTSTGAGEGEVILAVNTLLMQFFTLFSYVMDGFAYAGEALTGRYVGANDFLMLRRLIRLLFRWGFGLSILFTLLYAFNGNAFIALLTDDEVVVAVSQEYYYWALAIPLAGFSAFIWDGIFIGATATRYMLFSMLIASVSFFIMFYFLHNQWANHALWASFIVYLILRGVMQSFFGKSIFRVKITLNID